MELIKDKKNAFSANDYPYPLIYRHLVTFTFCDSGKISDFLYKIFELKRIKRNF
ncbi:hypothetical protein GHAL_2309 [Hafnia alvei ATCC 13337]|uniref:Uncharacterized protein n=1 Tax=Hafnia alvei ATCC 13337 TaxID=910996 RepID=A0ABD3ZGD7_HAFAL|nr:hypothetical protein GHAL_2309 [Hafnia alvei ATCC 13337]